MKTGLDFDVMVCALREQGVPLEKAMQAAAAATGVSRRSPTRPFPPTPRDEQRDPRVPEKDEQAAVVKLFCARGCTVRSTSQARASKVAVGLPDLWVTHSSLRLAFWFEVKRQVGGVVSAAQQAFGDDCRRCGVRWYVGDRYTARQVLRDEGLL